jgi:hypothetical protein
VVFSCIAEQRELKREGGRTRRGKWKGWVTPEMPTRTVPAVCCPDILLYSWLDLLLVDKRPRCACLIVD